MKRRECLSSTVSRVDVKIQRREWPNCIEAMFELDQGLVQGPMIATAFVCYRTLK